MSKLAVVIAPLLLGMTWTLPGCGEDEPADPTPAVDASPPPPPDAPPACADCAWLQRQRLEPSDGRRSDRFGDEVSIDGEVLVVGSKNHDLGDLDEGAAYVFERGADRWVETAKLVAGDADRNDEFGRSVAASGATVAVGAWQDDEGAVEAGAVYVFERGAQGFAQSAKLIADDARAEAFFGNAVALDGDVLAVGAFQDGGAETGAVYVFERAGAAWSQVAKLVPAGVSGGAHVGAGVALDGDTLVVGSPQAEGGGAVHVFERDGTTWREAAALERPADLASADQFGYDVAISGGTIAIGVLRIEQVPGVAYVYSETEGSWALVGGLTDPDAAHEARLGEAVAVGQDTVVLGAHRTSLSTLTSAGSIYVFQRDSGGWTLDAPTRADQPSMNESFGFALAISGETMVVGAVLDVAYVFERNPTQP